MKEFKDGSPVRSSFRHTAVFILIAIGLLLLGRIVFQVLGLLLLLATFMGAMIDRAYVTLDESEIRFRNVVWGRIEYKNVSYVEDQEPPSREYSGIWKYYPTPAQRQVLELMANHALIVHLRNSKWMWHAYPFPYPLRLSSVSVYLTSREDEEQFKRLVQEKIAE